MLGRAPSLAPTCSTIQVRQQEVTADRKYKRPPLNRVVFTVIRHIWLSLAGGHCWHAAIRNHHSTFVGL